MKSRLEQVMTWGIGIIVLIFLAMIVAKIYTIWF